MFTSLASLLVATSISAGLPFGLPPTAEDPLMSKVAPDECLAYVSWNGTAALDATSSNEFEKLLAEPEIKLLFGEINNLVGQGLRKLSEEEGPVAAEFAKQGIAWTKRLLTRPTAMFLSDVEIGPDKPSFSVGVVATVGDEGAELKALWEKLRGGAPEGAVEEIKIGSATMYRVKLGPGAPAITVGIKGKYLLAGIGEGVVEGMLKRAETEPPKWLTDLKTQLKVQRPSIVTYFNAKSIIEQVNAVLFGGDAGNEILDAVGVGNLTSIASVSGLDETGFTTRAILGTDGPLKGVLGDAIGQPLAAADLKPIPKDAVFAVAARFDLAKIFDSALTTTENFDAALVEDIRSNIGRMEESLGFRIRDDLLGSLGDVLCVYHSPGEGGLLGGLTGVWSVGNREKLDGVLKTLVGMAKAAERLGGGGRGMPRLTQMQFAGKDLWYFSTLGDEDIPLAPAWCLTDDSLIVAPFPQNIKAYLSRGEQYQSLAHVPEVEAALQSGGPIKLVYQNTPELFDLAYPMLQIFAHFFTHEMRREEIDIDISILPSGSSIRKHLRPDVLTVVPTDSGLVINSRQSLPGSNAPMVLPAFALAVLGVGGDIDDLEDLISEDILNGIGRIMMPEKASQVESINNMRQIGIAMHNYHDVYKKFPPAYSVNDDGKPLLSWRVHILPFIEEGHLYEQFKKDEPWDSEHNKKLIEQIPKTYKAPGSKQKLGMTNYLTIRHATSIFPGKDGLRMASITDGTVNTVMIVEASDAKAVPWTKPDDLSVDPMNAIKGLVGLRKGGFLALTADASAHKITETIDKDVLSFLFSRNDGNPIRARDFGADRRPRRRGADASAADTSAEGAVPVPK